MEPKIEPQISPQSQPLTMQQPLQPTPVETYQASSAIYEEIKDDIVRFFIFYKYFIN
jgi:hypothetical protein